MSISETTKKALQLEINRVQTNLTIAHDHLNQTRAMVIVQEQGILDLERTLADLLKDFETVTQQ